MYCLGKASHHRYSPGNIRIIRTEIILHLALMGPRADTRKSHRSLSGMLLLADSRNVLVSSSGPECASAIFTPPRNEPFSPIHNGYWKGTFVLALGGRRSCMIRCARSCLFPVSPPNCRLRSILLSPMGCIGPCRCKVSLSILRPTIRMPQSSVFEGVMEACIGTNCIARSLPNPKRVVYMYMCTPRASHICPRSTIRHPEQGTYCPKWVKL